MLSTAWSTVSSVVCTYCLYSKPTGFGNDTSVLRATLPAQNNQSTIMASGGRSQGVAVASTDQ